jgi:hypothetical protein
VEAIIVRRVPKLPWPPYGGVLHLATSAMHEDHHKEQMQLQWHIGCTPDNPFIKNMMPSCFMLGAQCFLCLTPLKRVGVCTMRAHCCTFLDHNMFEDWSSVSMTCTPWSVHFLPRQRSFRARYRSCIQPLSPLGCNLCCSAQRLWAHHATTALKARGARGAGDAHRRTLIEDDVSSLDDMM